MTLISTLEKARLLRYPLYSEENKRCGGTEKGRSNNYMQGFTSGYIWAGKNQATAKDW